MISYGGSWHPEPRRPPPPAAPGINSLLNHILLDFTLFLTRFYQIHTVPTTAYGVVLSSMVEEAEKGDIFGCFINCFCKGWEKRW